jgi:protease IV
MRRLLLLILLLSISIANDLNCFGGLSYSTSDNLDAITHNPAGLGVDRDIQLGFSINPNISDSSKIGIGFRSGSIGFFGNINKNGEYDYIIGTGSYSPDLNFYSGFSYSSYKNIYKTGFLYRPSTYYSIGLTYQYSSIDKMNGINLATAFKPIGNRLTFGFDIFNDNIADGNNIDITGFLDLKASNGIHLMASYNNSINSIQAGISFNTSNFNIFGLSNSNTNQNANISFRYNNQNSKGLKLPVKSKKKEKLNYIELTLNGIFIEEPEREKRSFNFDNLNFNPLSMVFGNNNSNYYQLRKFINKMDQISKDDEVDGMILKLESIGGGITKLIDVRNALQKFKNNGKKIIVYANHISNSSYLLASVADEIYIPELSDVDLRGLSIEVAFYKDLLDTLGIVFEVEQISPYKSALDPMIRNSMSKEMGENLSLLFSDVYEEFVSSISEGRGWAIEKTKKVIDNGPYRDDQAIIANLINGTMYPDEFDTYISKIDDKNVIKKQFNSISEPVLFVNEWYEEKNKIAVIYAVGGINLGKSQRGIKGPSSVMGNETISHAIKSARLDKNVKGIVLRIDSGGGSALASDLMWREVYKTTELDTFNIKPFVASMADVAASGGYYIACQADKIMASPSTVTGSIGVISGRPNLSGLKNKLGIHTDGIKFGKHADYYSDSDLWNDEERGILREGILHVYGKFLQRVANGRDVLDSLAVHEVAIGKVWSGVRAKTLNLVDEIGNLNDAIELVAEMAKLENQNYEIEEYPKREHSSRFSFGGNGANLSNSIYLKGTLKEIQETLNGIPDFHNDKNQMVLPYRIIFH